MRCRLSLKCVALFGGILFVVSTGCHSSSRGPSGNAELQDGELIVSAAASLKDAFNEIGQLYESRNHARVRFNYGASVSLQKQIEAGAPVDVFASAGTKQMDELEEKSLIDSASRKDFARNELVLIVPAKDSSGVSSLSDLNKPQIARIAVGNPKTVPAGQYTQQALTTANLLPQIYPKLVFAEDVRQVLDYVVRGEVQAGIVYVSDALSGGDRVRVVARVPEDSHSPILYPIAVVRQSEHREGAQKFVDLVLSPEGLLILRKYGFADVR